MDEQPRLPMEVRAAAAPAIQAYLAFQDSQIILLQEQIVSLQGDLGKLRLQLADALARAHQHSGNSSRPPSSDPPSAPARPKKAPSGRKRGGQKGHLGHTRLQLSAENLSGVVEHRAVQCPSCSLPLSLELPTEGEPERVQVWEIPPITPQVTEHRGYRVRCPHCAVLVPAPDLPDGAFGPRLTAIGSVLHGRFRLSMRETTEVLGDLFGVPLGVGSVATLCQDVSAALSEPYAAVRAQVEAETHANVDETGWQQAGDKRWLWVAVTALCSLFVVAKHRSAAVLLSLLGEGFDGVVSSDRFKAYLSIPVERRQICWAHLKRNLLAFAERGGPVGDWGKEAVGIVEKVFAAWYRYKDGGGDRAALQGEITPLRQDLQEVWARGAKLPSWMVRGFCADVGKLEPALWTFVRVEGVEPTNNAAERSLRPAVLWRKGCFGADSTNGNAFVAKILTASATCRQQNRHLLTYLTDAVAAYRDGQPAPSLLPV
jgi:transposase